MVKPFQTLWALALAAALPLAAAAQDRGQVTNLPLPRFVSMKAAEGYVRRGPSRTHRIDWIFRKRDTPLEITAEHGHWRRVRDRDGAGGWMHYSLLSGVRTVLIEQDMLQMRGSPDPKSLVVAQLELGVIARIEECTRDWCDLSVGGYGGWVPKSAIWGVGAEEILD
ncbi:SH3 domain-containing protein [Roseovarius dicentrarchi]|uniref:SH3 domain-containing protein n=1 Tax=Roseovarius dicentrarchi TaxID=2250573 RepID=UPI000DEBA98A|nr:SH3 domain-containing protein [Roseovarius dicentrarchi]